MKEKIKNLRSFRKKIRVIVKLLKNNNKLILKLFYKKLEGKWVKKFDVRIVDVYSCLVWVYINSLLGWDGEGWTLVLEF